ncbi:T9SS type A sorting domain-containing protein [bacterium]|nr:T9SS type A sorting domain-containing protein [bacterium]
MSWTDQEATAHWPIRIAISSTGVRCVSWENGTQFLSPAGQQVGGILESPAWMGGVEAVGPGTWVFLRLKDSSWNDTGTIHWSKTVTIDLRTAMAVESTRDTVIQFFGQQPPYSEGDYHWEYVYRSYTVKSASGLLFATAVGVDDRPGGLFYKWNEARWSLWRSRGDLVRHSSRIGQKTLSGYLQDPHVCMAAKSASGLMYLLIREREESGRDGFAVSQIDGSSGERLLTTTLDPMQATHNGDIADFVPYDDGHTEVISLIPGSDSLVVRRYDESGRVDDEILLCPEINIVDNEVIRVGWPDASHVMLKNGNHLLSYSRKDAVDSTHLYIAMYDREWSPVGTPRRVSNVPSNQQICAGLAVHNDSVAIAWLDSREQYPGIYYRCFPIDYVTDVSTAPTAVPTPLYVHPNPVRQGQVAFIEIDGAQHEDLLLFDALGRKKLSLPAEQLTVLRTANLPRGVYFLVSPGAQAIQMKQLIVL